MISVCMATYNGEPFIKEQISSILSQLGPEDELLISDDGSTDRTRFIINSFQDRRIVLFDGPKRGVVDNFNFVLSKAKGDYIFLSDQDDIWMPNKVERCLLKMSRDNIDLVISDCNVINENNEVLHRSFYSLNRSRPGFIKNLLKNSYLGCCLAFNRKALSLFHPFPRTIPMHDWWIGTCLEFFGYKIAFIDERLIGYRRHGGNLSPSSEKSTYSIFSKISFRTSILLNLFALKLRLINK